MEWEPDGFSLGGKKPASLPTLLGSSSIDDGVDAMRTEDDEIKHGGEMVSPIIILSESFPHIAARIAQFWGKEKDFDDYIGPVATQDRTSRRGFPQPVMNAILQIWNEHRAQFSNEQECVVPWLNDTRLHKAFKKLEQESSFSRLSSLTGAEAAILDRNLTERAQMEAARVELEQTGKPLVVGDGPITL